MTLLEANLQTLDQLTSMGMQPNDAAGLVTLLQIKELTNLSKTEEIELNRLIKVKQACHLH